MADRVIRLSDGQHCRDPRQRREEGGARAVLVTDARPRPQAAARPLAPARPGAGDRRGDHGRRRDAGDVARRPTIRWSPRATASTPSTASPTCSRSLKRAPEPVAERLRALPGVERLETRVSGRGEARGGRVSPTRSPACCCRCRTRASRSSTRLHLKRGRMVQPYSSRRGGAGRLLRRRAPARAGRPPRRHHQRQAQDSSPSSASRCRRSTSTRSRPGAMFPDFKRYGVLWTGRNALAAAYDMEGAFNDVSAHAGARRPRAGRDRPRRRRPRRPTAAPAPTRRADQFSNRFLSEELKQLQTTATLFPGDLPRRRRVPAQRRA